MNIAILVCAKLTYDCSGTGCFEAFNKKKDSFKIYKNSENLMLKSFFHCNGCKSNLKNDLEYKIKQLKVKNVEVIHLAKCIEVECSRYNEIKSFFQECRFKVVDGTHN